MVRSSALESTGPSDMPYRAVEAPRTLSLQSAVELALESLGGPARFLEEVAVDAGGG
jgi:hypothetical protein